MPEQSPEIPLETKGSRAEDGSISKEQEGESEACEQDKKESKKDEPYDAMRNEPCLTNLIVETYVGEKDERGFFHGIGTTHFQGGHIYSGSFVNGLMHESGKYIWVSGIMYEGDFKNNVIDGQGTYTWTDGSSYEGGVKNGLRHGQGTYVCGSIPSSYTGEWRYGKRSGHGILRYDKDGLSYYDGHWMSNKRHGYGIRRYVSGNIYKGDWRNNGRHGLGTMHWYDKNEKYDGQWENGIQHGQGEHSWYLNRIPGSQYPLRNYYIGEWINGMRHGHGTFYYATGAKYVGEWMNNMKHGQGKYVFKNGMVFEGTFELDHMLDFPDVNPSGMISPDITKSGLPLRSGTPIRSASPFLTSENSGNPLNLSIDLLMDERDLDLYEREEELQQVTYVMLRHVSRFKQIYSFYSGLGQEVSPDNTFVMSQLQFWRFLKDCKAHHHGFTISELDRVIAAERSNDIHEPQHEVLMRDFLNAVIIIAYRLYKTEHCGNEPLLPWCVSKLVTLNILDNACRVRGSLFSDASKAIDAIQYMSKSWDIFWEQCTPNVHYPHEPIFKARQFLFMLHDFHLINQVLTPKEVLDILAMDNPDLAQDDFCNLELEMTFLEFFEGLIDCATVYVTETVVKGHLTPKESPVPSSRSRSVASFTPATSKPGVESLEEADQDHTVISAAETPGGAESPDRVSRIMSEGSEHKPSHSTFTAESTTKSREAAPPEPTASAKSTEFIQPTSQEGSKRVQSHHSGTNLTGQSAGDMEQENVIDVQISGVEDLPDPSQIEQYQLWSLQLSIFFEKFFEAADRSQMVKKAQEKK